MRLAADADYIHPGLKAVNEIFMADLRICWRIGCFFKSMCIEVAGVVDTG